MLHRANPNVVVMGRVSQASDSVITEKVTKTADKIQTLTHEVAVLKKENNELKAKLGDTVVRVNKHFNLLPVNEPDNGKPGTSSDE